MTSLDVRNLAQIENAIRLKVEVGLPGAWTFELPERAVPAGHADPPNRNREPSPEVMTSLSNLDRLGCVMPIGLLNEANSRPELKYKFLSLSPFGRALIEACTK
jgi:hypothetical protein